MIFAVSAHMSADGTTAAGHSAYSLVHRMAAAAWAAAVGSLGAGFPGVGIDSGFSATRLLCYLGAMADLFIALQGCAGNPSCAATAQAIYATAILACDAA